MKNSEIEKKLGEFHFALFQVIARNLSQGMIPIQEDVTADCHFLPPDRDGFRIPLNVVSSQNPAYGMHVWAIYKNKIFMSGTLDGVRFSYQKSQWSEPKEILNDCISTSNRFSIAKMSHQIMDWAHEIMEVFFMEEYGVKVETNNKTERFLLRNQFNCNPGT